MTAKTKGGAHSEIQKYINKILREKIPIEAFIKEHVSSDSIKNTVDVYCPVCGSDEVNVTTKQTRSIDEAATNFFKCLRCGYISKKFLHNNGTADFKKKIKELNDTYNGK